jgi:hypothetical protein
MQDIGGKVMAIRTFHLSAALALIALSATAKGSQVFQDDADTLGNDVTQFETAGGNDMIGGVSGDQFQITTVDNGTNAYTPDKAGVPLGTTLSGTNSFSALYNFDWSSLNTNDASDLAAEEIGFLGAAGPQTRQVMGVILRHWEVPADEGAQAGYYVGLDLAFGSVGITDFGYKASGNAIYIGQNVPTSTLQLAIGYNSSSETLSAGLYDGSGNLLGFNTSPISDLYGANPPSYDKTGYPTELSDLAVTYLGWADYTYNGNDIPTTWQMNSLSYYNDPTGAFPAAAPAWVLTGGGDWNVASNWTTDAVPNAVGAEADLYNAITANSTIFTNTAITVGTLHFNSGNSYLINGAGSLTLQAPGTNPALVEVDAGAQELNLPVTIASNTTLNVATDASLLIASPITVNTGEAVTQTGGGTVTYQSDVTLQSSASLTLSNSTTGGALSLASGAHFTVSASTAAPYTVQFNSVSLGSAAVIDLTNNVLVINYGSNSDPAQMVRSELISGLNAGGAKWTGTGIISSLAASNPSAYTLGYADGGNPVDAANTGVPAGEVVIAYTVAGDVNLSGAVDLSDLVIVASGFGETGADWAQGDVNYDGNVDLSDLVIVASNFGSALGNVAAADFSLSFQTEWQLALAEVHAADVQMPEPTSIGFLLAASVLLARRRGTRTQYRALCYVGHEV